MLPVPQTPESGKMNPSGLVESRIPVIGSLVECLVAAPSYRWYMRRTLAALKVAAERRASRSRRYAAAPTD